MKDIERTEEPWSQCVRRLPAWSGQRIIKVTIWESEVSKEIGKLGKVEN